MLSVKPVNSPKTLPFVRLKNGQTNTKKSKNIIMYKALGIGEIVLDKSIILSDYPKEDSKVRPEKVKYSLGGPVTAALILLSRLGVRCTLVASIGNDAAGKLIRQKIANEKIKLVSQIVRKTKQNTVLINKKKASRTIIKDSSPTAPITNVPKKLIKNSDIFIFDRHEPCAFDLIIKDANKTQKIIFDPSVELSQKTLHMAKHSTWPIFPIEVLAELGAENMQKALEVFYKLLNKKFILTAGQHGSILFDGEKMTMHPALEIEPIDTLGAGDVYRGAFAWGLLNGWSIEKCMQHANIAAGLQCTRIGNGSAVPEKKEITKVLLNPKFRKKNNLDINFTLPKSGLV